MSNGPPRKLSALQLLLQGALKVHEAHTTGTCLVCEERPALKDAALCQECVNSTKQAVAAKGGQVLGAGIQQAATKLFGDFLDGLGKAPDEPKNPPKK